MKGQTQALTAVLITAVTIGTVATAYVWGTPLLEKRQSKAQLDSLENDILNLRDEIVSVSRGGQGTTSEIQLQMDGRLEVFPGKDYIEVNTQAQAPPYPAGTWTLIKGKNRQNLTIGTGSYGVLGSDLPGVVAVRAASGPGSSSITYRIEFRNLYADTPSGARLRKIDLTSVGRKTATGDTTLLISNEGAVTDRVEVGTGENLERTRRQVSVDIQ
ncbi:MAG: hypothetical protein ABEJ07_03490 [Candidatus Nanohaloarchaea archaeon]